MKRDSLTYSGRINDYLGLCVLLYRENELHYCVGYGRFADHVILISFVQTEQPNFIKITTHDLKPMVARFPRGEAHRSNIKVEIAVGDYFAIFSTP